MLIRDTTYINISACLGEMCFRDRSIRFSGEQAQMKENVLDTKEIFFSAVFKMPLTLAFRLHFEGFTLHL